jgi:hypothetical protein
MIRRIQLCYLPWFCGMVLITMHRYALVYQWCAIAAMTSSAYHLSFSVMDYAFSLMDNASRGSYPSDRADYWAHISTPPCLKVGTSLVRSFYACEMAGIAFVLRCSICIVIFTSWLVQWVMFAIFSVVCVQSGLIFNTFAFVSVEPPTHADPLDMITFFLMSSMCLPVLLRIIYKAALFAVIDVPSVALESLMPNSLASLHKDINSLLSAPEWSPDEDDPNQTAKLTTAQPPPPSPQRSHPLTARCKIGLSKWWRLLLFSLCIPYTPTQAVPEIECISISDSPQLSFSARASFRGERPKWKDRRKWKRQSEKIEDAIPNPFSALNVQEVPATPKDEDSSESNGLEPRMDNFIKSFDPASAGMRLLLAERIDRVMIRSKLKKKRRVSVHLEQCRQQISVSAGRWFFPAADESVFNSLCDGFDAPLIVDTGASCCISPHREDFITYSDSKVKVKDLSGSNKVAGEGMVKWKVLDKDGLEVELELKAYHMPNASVRLLSPQSMIKSIEGTKGFQDVLKYTLKIPGGIILEAPYGRANLPLLPLSSKDKSCFWSRCFNMEDDSADDWAKLITSASNQNLTAAKKELLVWHHKLSHAALSTVHSLCRHKRKSKDETISDFVPYRDGPFLPCSHKMPDNVCANLLCAACCIAKAKRRAPAV